MWSERQAGIPHPVVTIILILAWAVFLICLKNQELPYSFQAARPWTLLRMKDLTAFSHKLVFILMTKQGYSCFFPIGQAPGFCPKL